MCTSPGLQPAGEGGLARCQVLYCGQTTAVRKPSSSGGSWLFIAVTLGQLNFTFQVSSTLAPSMMLICTCGLVHDAVWDVQFFQSPTVKQARRKT